MPANTFAIRRDNLRQLVLGEEFEGNRAAFSRRVGIHQNQINLFLTDNENHRRNLGEALARKIEEALGLAPLYMDQPHSGGAETCTLGAVASDSYRGIFRADDAVSSMALTGAFLAQLSGRITSPDSLRIGAVMTRDVSDLAMGQTVVIDTAVKGASTDGVYVLQKGSDVYLRRLTKQLSGGWKVEGGGGVEVLESLKSIKITGRVVMSWRCEIL